MNNEEIWQMGGVKSYEVIDQIKADSDLSMSSGSAKRIGEAIESQGTSKYFSADDA